jgi:hypothetical protein
MYYYRLKNKLGYHKKLCLGLETHGSVVLKAGSRPDEVIFFSIYVILSAALGPGVHSATSTNEYQEQKNNVSGE